MWCWGHRCGVVGAVRGSRRLGLLPKRRFRTLNHTISQYAESLESKQSIAGALMSLSLRLATTEKPRAFCMQDSEQLSLGSLGDQGLDSDLGFGTSALTRRILSRGLLARTMLCLVQLSKPRTVSKSQGAQGTGRVPVSPRSGEGFELEPSLIASRARKGVLATGPCIHGFVKARKEGQGQGKRPRVQKEEGAGCFSGRTSACVALPARLRGALTFLAGQPGRPPPHALHFKLPEWPSQAGKLLFASGWQRLSQDRNKRHTRPLQS